MRVCLLLQVYPTQGAVCYLPIPSFPEFLVKSSAPSGQDTLIRKGLADPDQEGGSPHGGPLPLPPRPPPSLLHLACVMCLLFYV